jgi:hypothetical protein
MRSSCSWKADCGRRVKTWSRVVSSNQSDSISKARTTVWCRSLFTHEKRPDALKLQLFLLLRSHNQRYGPEILLEGFQIVPCRTVVRQYEQSASANASRISPLALKLDKPISKLGAVKIWTERSMTRIWVFASLVLCFVSSLLR